MIPLYDHQREALDKIHNGSILCGGVGSGKSRTAIAYFVTRENDGNIDGDNFVPMSNPCDLYIITTAMKRDSLEWEGELLPFLLQPKNNYYDNKVVIDSWNNIAKYCDVKGAFFIFDEQRVVGSGKWTKSFITISKNNRWILLSATPGDTWMDYIPVFIANGFYRNRTEFKRRHVVYNRYSKFPKVDRYLEEKRLRCFKDRILVKMEYTKPTISHHEIVTVDYDRQLYSMVMKTRFNIYKNEPLKDAGQLCYTLRRVVNSDPSRLEKLKELMDIHKKIIVFYNFDYELEALRDYSVLYNYIFAEWNGHKHEELPTGESWLYFVQYAAGAEGWNCITTNAIIFFSQNYSYKATVQAAGRIDRMNTPYRDLYYYHFKSNSTIDTAIQKALKRKKNFNERSFAFSQKH